MEHVTPLWITRRFLATASHPAHFTLHHDGVPQRRSRTINHKVKVCADCNNGWMSRLEQAARPFLEGFADNLLTSLSKAEQEVLA